MSKPILRIVQGFIGSGKTTYSKLLSEKTGSIRLNADEYCEDTFSKEELEQDWNNCFSKAISDLYILAENYLESGQSVILDFGFWDKKSRDYARNLAMKVGVDFQHIYLDTPDNIIIGRLKGRSGIIAARNLSNFDTLKRAFELPQSDEAVIIVRSDQIPPPSI
jgi:predicted kinase